MENHTTNDVGVANLADRLGPGGISRAEGSVPAEAIEQEIRAQLNALAARRPPEGSLVVPSEVVVRDGDSERRPLRAAGDDDA